MRVLKCLVHMPLLLISRPLLLISRPLLLISSENLEMFWCTWTDCGPLVTRYVPEQT